MGKKIQNMEILLKDSDYKTLFKNNTQSMILHNLKGEIVDINDSTLKMLGYSISDLKKIKMKNLIKKVIGVKKFNLLNILRDTINKGNLKMKFEFLKKNGESFLGEITARTVILSNGLNVLMLIDNVTEQKILQENLEKEKKFSEKLVESAPNIVVGLGIDSKILIFNKFAEKLTGYKAKEVLGKEWIKIFIPKKDQINIYKIWKSVVNNKKIYYNYENVIITKEGREKIISWNNACINCEGDFKLVLSIGKDVTEKSKNDEIIRSSEMLLKNTISSMEDLVFVFDANKKFIYHHSPKNSILYSDPNFFIGKKISEVMPKKIVEEFNLKFEIIKKGAVVDFNYSLSIKGIEMNFQARLSPMIVGNEFKGCVAVIRHL